MKFKVGDIVRAVNNVYAFTNIGFEWEGQVTFIDGIYFSARTTKSKQEEDLGFTFESLNEIYFELAASAEDKENALKAWDNLAEFATHDEKISINEWAEILYNIADEHGWHDEKRSFGDIIALCHSELSEALEEYRNGNEFVYIENGKPEGKAVELIDCIIRILEYLWGEGINIEQVLEEKCEYNKTRPYRHGGKVL